MAYPDARIADLCPIKMIPNSEQSALYGKAKIEADSNPVVKAVMAAVAASPYPFEIEESSSGLEVLAHEPLPNNVPNRARMKIFSPQPGHTRVFFFKKSLVPFSRDRYSYGGLDLPRSEVEASEIQSWLTFLASGFHPEKRPEKLRRAFPYEIPE